MDKSVKATFQFPNWPNEDTADHTIGNSHFRGMTLDNGDTVITDGFYDLWVPRGGTLTIEAL